MDLFDPIHDPYRRCEETCTHDLARGVTVADLLSADGPHNDATLIVSFTPQRRPSGVATVLPAAS